MHRKVTRTLVQLGLTEDALPLSIEDWKVFLSTFSSIIQELSDRIEFTENVLAVSTAEMETLYARLRESSANELKESHDKLLKKSEENEKILGLMNATLESTTEGILVVEHSTGKIQRSNQRFLELWKIPQELAEERDDEKLLQYVLNQLSEPQLFIDGVKKLYNEPQKRSFDILNFLDGRVFERLSVPLCINGSIISRVWFFRDITEVRKREAEIDRQRMQLMQSAKLSSLGEMSGGIAHEINNPLAIIAGFSQMGRKILSSSSPDLNRVASILTNIDNSVNRIAKIIKGLRFLAREGSEDPYETVKVNDMIEEATQVCKEKFSYEGIEFIQSAIAVDLIIECRLVQISQIVLNLLNNARFAVQKLEKKWVKIEVKDAGDYVDIFIWDSGTGIPEHVAKRIFDPFFTTKKVGEGTGLGLSISKSIAQSHHGDLKIDSKASNTCFILSLPKIQSNNKEERIAA